MAPLPDSRHYRKHGAVAVRYQAMTGAASPGAAHQRTLRLEAEFFQYCAVLRLSGSRDTLMRLWCRFQEEIQDGTLPELPTVLRLVGNVDRSEDEARETALLGGYTPTELRILESRTRREIDAKTTLCRAIRRELEGK